MTVKNEVRRCWSESAPWIWTAMIIALVVVTAVTTIGALCEVLYGTLWHALALMVPFVVLTTVVSRWSQRRREAAARSDRDR
ncbi:hypothetical protein [Gordonia phthalatica]|uniref:Uncharacterized protein n=1 Tax=Gordonia phthalatica TaxID=1136941 RepID=A0A0N9NEH5_9ACTN|nr:hypothetical protein [Gordonia phthalatica]ALG86113.1 hypothetical protein ACH46_18450 [Gordonia phthalatica]